MQIFWRHSSIYQRKQWLMMSQNYMWDTLLILLISFFKCHNIFTLQSSPSYILVTKYEWSKRDKIWIPIEKKWKAKSIYSAIKQNYVNNMNGDCRLWKKAHWWSYNMNVAWKVWPGFQYLITLSIFVFQSDQGIK